MPWKLTGNNLVKRLVTEHKTLLSCYVNLQVALCFVNSQNENSMSSKCKIEVVVSMIIVVVVVFDEERIFKHLFIKSEKKRNCK